MKLSNDRAFTLIKNAVPVNYTLAEPFCAKALRDHSWREYTDYYSFLANNCKNVPDHAAPFVRVDRGRHCIFDQPEHPDTKIS